MTTTTVDVQITSRPDEDTAPTMGCAAPERCYYPYCSCSRGSTETSQELS